MKRKVFTIDIGEMTEKKAWECLNKCEKKLGKPVSKRLSWWQGIWIFPWY